jgi:hypothetical protein
MLKIFYDGEYSCPIINCDVCQDSIGSVLEGVARFYDRGPWWSKTDVLHAHHACKDQLPKDMLGEQTLREHFRMLCANTEYIPIKEKHS